MIRPRAELACVVLLLSFGVSALSAKTPPKPATKLSKVLCHEKAAGIELAKLGIPDDERPVDVALAKDYVYVLLQPARLARITRGGGQMEVTMKLGAPGETWTAIDVDPTDGSVWIATEEFVLRRITPTFALSSVRLQRVEGTGGFLDLAVARDAIYATPTCSEDGIWRIDRSGKILGSAFSMPKPEAGAVEEPARLDEMPGCNPVQIERDQNGRVIVWSHREGKVQQADDQGAWSEGPAALFAKLPASNTVRGLDVGGRSERWYLSRRPENLFFWKGKPVFVGNIVTKSVSKGLGIEHDTTLYVPEGDRVREVVEDCHGAYLIDVAADETGYVALTDRGLIFGDFATAPDLQ